MNSYELRMVMNESIYCVGSFFKKVLRERLDDVCGRKNWVSTKNAFYSVN